MRWTVFIAVAYLLTVLQVGLAEHLGIPSSAGRVKPEFLLLLAVFVALSAPTQTTVIACGVLGLLMDLTTVYAVVHLNPEGEVVERLALTLIGPYVLGYIAGGYLVVQFRPMLFRQHPLTLATMMLLAGLAVHMVVMGIFSIRRFYEPLDGFELTTQFTHRGLTLLYSATLGLILAYPLIKLGPFFGFSTSKPSTRNR